MILKRLFSLLVLLTTAIILVACGVDEDGQDVPVADVEDVNDSGIEQIEREAPANSDYAGVTMYINDIAETVVPGGATAGTLEVVVVFENTTDDTITLALDNDSYVITDGAGLNYVPSAISTELVNPEIGAGESIEGVIEYATDSSSDTYTFDFGDFETFTYSESVAD